MIKKLLAGAALVLASQSSAAFYVVGDSLSAWKQSWPQVMREQYGSWIRADVQSGRALISYEPSPDVIAIDGHRLAIMALGFNDGYQYKAGLATPQDYFNKLAGTVAQWRKGQFPFRKVIIVIPPNTPKSEPEHAEMRLQAQVYCALVVHYWQQEWLHCVDWNAIGYFNNTSDGVHPTHSFSREIAAYMHNEINKFAPEAL